MRILDFFQLNDWKIGSFLKLVTTFQISVVALTFLDSVNLGILFTRQVLCFIYLTVLPGMVILRALKIHDLGSAETLYYSVGLSLALIIFSGLFINTIYLILDVPKPFSISTLLVAFITLVTILCLICYIRDKDYVNPKFLEIRLSPSLLFLCIPPFLVFLGTYLVNYYNNNLILMFSLVVIGIIPVLVAFDVVEEKLYPLALFTTSVSLLYHTSLISTHVWGWDIQVEYYFSRRALLYEYWDPNLYGAINGMPAITILAPIYAAFCAIDLIWVFKMLYPLLFSFVPLTMYTAFRKTIGEKASFLASSLFAFVGTFYFTMIQLARQQVAEIFLALILLTIMNKNFKSIYRSLLMVIWGISLIMSHYGTAYLLMLVLIAYSLTSLLIRYSRMLSPRLHQQIFDNRVKPTLNPSFVVLYSVTTLTWYMHIAGSHPFEVFIRSVQIIFEEFINPFQSDAFQLLIRGAISPLHEVTKILHLITQFLTVIGILNLLLEREIRRIRGEYFLLSLIFFGIWVLSAILPYYGFDFTRVYHITLIVLSPFYVIGGLALAKFLKSLSSGKLDITPSRTLKVTSVFLCIFLLFNSGWVYELVKDNPTSIALSDIDYPVFNKREVAGARWLHMLTEEGKIYADSYRWLLLIGFKGYPFTWYSHYESRSPMNLFIFLGTFNIKSGTVLERYEVGPRIPVEKHVRASDILEGASKVYDNGGAQIFLKKT